MKITAGKVKKGLLFLRHYGLREFLIRLGEKMEAEQVPYGPWYERHKASGEELRRQKKASERLAGAPLISILVPLYNTREAHLREMIASVQAQSYEKWELILADASDAPVGGAGRASVASGRAAGAGASDGVDGTPTAVETAQGRIAAEFSRGDSRISYIRLRENGGIAANTNAALERARGEWVAFLDHDDLLAPDALYEAVALILKGPSRGTRAEGASFIFCQDGGDLAFDMVYTDEDKVDAEGREHFSPHLKPDFNLDLLRSNNYITHFLLVRTSLAREVGGLRGEYDGAQDYDFIFRCAERARAIGHVPRILYHWRSHEDSTADCSLSKGYAAEAGRRAIEDHLRRTGTPGEVSLRADVGFYDVRYPAREGAMVSILIPSRDQVESLKKCLSAIGRSSYGDYEVIVMENNSAPETFSYYRSIAPGERMEGGHKVMEGRMPGGQRLLVAVWEGGFNYSAINNFGASFARGEYLLFMNNDVEMIGDGWMAAMLGTCMRPEVAAVGAKLYYPDDTVQHAGIVVGIGGNARGIAQNMFAGLRRERSGYMHKASIAMDYSAVTAACMMASRGEFEEAGGFTEELSIAFNDVDLCLKMRELRVPQPLIVYQPAAEGYHYESKSRGEEDSPEKVARFQSEIEYMRERWIGILKNGDPYYNPCLSSIYPDYSLRDNMATAPGAGKRKK